MPSIVLTEPFQVSVADTPKPTPAAGEALLKMVYGGVCGSDLASYRGVSPYVSYPRTLGHEFSAEVVEVGDNPHGIRPGMLVTALPYFACGTCRGCRLGKPNACRNNQTMGVQREGAFSTWFTLPTERIYDGTGIDPRALALVEPFAISHHAVTQGKVGPGDKVLVFGAGAIGILAAVAARSRGAEAWIADISQEKLDRAVEQFGLDGGLNSANADEMSARVAELTGGDGFDVTIEAAGAAAAFEAAVEHTATLGRVVEVGVSSQRANFDQTMLQRKELTMVGSRGATAADFAACLALVREGDVDLTRLVTFETPAAEAPDAFTRLHRESAVVTKVLFRF
ncbi:zinc-binding alcohol dehydrogenase family protein [Tessaracoccus terricola]